MDTRTKVFARQSRRYFEHLVLTVASAPLWLSLDVSNQAPGPETLMTHIKLSTKTLAMALLLLSMQTAQAQYTGTLAFNNVESGAAYAYGTNSTAIGIGCTAFDVIEGEGARVLGIGRL